MTSEQIERYQKWLANNEHRKDTRIMGSYWNYLNNYLNGTDIVVDGQSWTDRMKAEPMPMNIYLYG